MTQHFWPDERTEKLMQWAAEATDLSLALYGCMAFGTGRLPTVSDPIEGEMARLMAEFYRRVALGENTDIVFVELCDKARIAAREYNARQSAAHGDSNDWRAGYAGYYGEDAAETKMRHAFDMVKGLPQ